MTAEQNLNSSAPRSSVGCAFPPRRPSGRAVVLLSMLVAALVAGPVSAQSPQPGTPAPIPSVPPGNSPRAEGPAQATPDPDLSEEDDDDAEGCPYLGQPLELVV